MATIGAAALWRLRTGRPQDVAVDARAAAAAFRSERYLRVEGRPPPEMWAGISGFYRAADGRWIQFHCNFPHHRDGVLRVLGCDADRAGVAARIAERQGGTYLVRTSLAQAARWLDGLGRLEDRAAPEPTVADVEDFLEDVETPFGRTRRVRPAACLSETPPAWTLPSAAPRHARARLAGARPATVTSNRAP